MVAVLDSKDKMKKNKTIKSFKSFGILNAYGDFWTTETFKTKLEANKYMEKFWDGVERKPDMSKHKIVPIEIRILRK